MSDTESVTETRIDDFKKAVHNWLEINEQLAELRKKTSELNKKKKSFSDIITHYMQTEKKEICNLGDSGALELKSKKTTLTLKKDYVQELLTHFLKDEHVAKESAEYIFSNKPTKETKVLNHTNRVLS